MVGPRGYEVVSCEWDFREGGSWRVVQRNPEGEQFGFRGEFKEISRPGKIVWTFEFEGAPGYISTETLSLTENGGITTLTASAIYQSVEHRDAMLQSGMEKGAAETWDRLAEYVETIR